MIPLMLLSLAFLGYDDIRLAQSLYCLQFLDMCALVSFPTQKKEK